MKKSNSTRIAVFSVCALLLVSCARRWPQRFSAENLRFIPSEATVVLRIRNEDGHGPVRYFVVRSLPGDYASGFGAYLYKHGKSISGGLITVESFWGTWSNTESKRDDLCMTFRRPLTAGEVDTSWGTGLPYRSASIVRDTDLPPSLVTNRNTEISFTSCEVIYTDQRVKSSRKYQSGP
jgi:hypothetical protein